MSVQEADQRVVRALRERHHRVTPQRLLINRALRELNRHSTADEVMERVSEDLPNASLPTVYATLELFEQLGLVRRVGTGRGPALFDPRTDEHAHLVCRECGAVEDLETPVEAKAALRVARRSGFAPEAAELVVRGRCRACAR